MSSSLPVILASASPRRRALLEAAGIAIEVHPSGADEPPHSAGHAQEYCLDNARVKAQEVAARFPGRFILGADTEVILDGEALGKPVDRAHGRALLTRLSGRSHTVMTAFVLIHPDGRLIEGGVETEVVVKTLRPDEIEGYLDTGEPFDKAGGYGIQGIGGFMIEAIRGSYSNVVGLPVVEVLAMLEAAGGPRAFSAPASRSEGLR